MAKLNPFRFSTKYQDDETDLLYYGYRYYNASTGRWLSRDPMEEDGALCLYAACANDLINGWDYLGMLGNGHHVFPQSLSREMAEEVRKFFDQDMNRIFNDFYRSHGAEKMEGISAKKYNQLVSEELEKFLGKQSIKTMTLKQAEEFMAHLNSLPQTSGITIYNNAIRRAALRAELTKAAERAAASSLVRLEESGARMVGGKKLTKAIPLVGTVVAVYFIYEDAQVYGYGPAIINGGIDAIPLVGTGKIGSELIAGGRWLDVTDGPKEVKPSKTDCPGE